MKKNLKELLKSVRSGLRLRTKPPQVFRDRSKYTRKMKHKKKRGREEQG